MEKMGKDSQQYIALMLTVDGVPLREIEEVYSFIEANMDNIHTYYIHSEPGHVVAAAFDYTIILNALNSIASNITIAEALWKTYQKFIGSPKTSPNDNKGINIGIPISNDKIMTLGIGSEFRDKNIFIETFVSHIEELKQNPENFRVAINIMSDIEHSKIWVKRKLPILIHC